MTRQEALEEYQRQTELLMTMQIPDDEATMPIVAIKDELEGMITKLKNKNGTFRKAATVEKALTNADMLTRALTVPTQIRWNEPTGETERDPVSGNPRPKMAQKSEGVKCGELLYAIKQNLVACTRVLAAYARHIAAPSAAEWRDIYVSLEAYFARHSATNPLAEDFAREIVSRFAAALFALWADNEIEKEVRHV